LNGDDDDDDDEEEEEEDRNRAWGSTGENVEVSATENLRYYELKQNKDR
jgi:hypothetical protein